ncbi:MAG TPA: tRNA (adenosine(37)-N6)-threonylcarbamoyltransferase complex dimerization subunit type 1 TsaB, partial [bacterium]|nr:tRNA (adenosine(37)-N6)-threonylcarbamoyltransferase complex dimerization subunit type 1 TsaB [bacterium]
LMPAIESLLASEKEALEGIICATGPGSFTGVRIGLATANALAYGYDIPVTGVSLLDVWMKKALDFFSSATSAAFRDMHTNDLASSYSLHTIIDAGRDEVYLTSYRRQHDTDPADLLSWKQEQEAGIARLPQAAGTTSTTPALLDKLTQPAIIAGSIKSAYSEHLISTLGSEHLLLLYVDRQIDLSDQLCALGIPRLAAKQRFADTGSIRPDYIREAHITRSK